MYGIFILKPNSSEISSIGTLLILSIIAIFYSVTACNGCDFVRLYHTSIDDVGTSQLNVDDSYVGLGIFSHQTFITDADTNEVNRGSICKPYDSNQSIGSKLSPTTGTKALITYSIASNVIVMIILFCAGLKAILKGSVEARNQMDIFFFCILISTLSAISLVLQTMALDISGRICDRHNYLVEEMLIEKYIFSREIELFYKCTSGPEQQRVLRSMILFSAMIGVGFISAIAMTIELYLKEKKAMLLNVDGLTVCEEDDSDEDDDHSSVNCLDSEVPDTSIESSNSV